MPLSVESTASLSRVDAAAFDALVPPSDPFTRHAFLLGLEETGCVGAEAGWLPVHLLVRDEAGRLFGAAPLYLKDHSYGEYIFDWGWAAASERAGIPYYPKLVSAVPFTPATGGRLLVHPAAPAAEVRAALAEGLRALADETGAMSIHVLFCDRPTQSELGAHGFLARITSQYHWENRDGWTDFDDFLGALRAPARKAVRRERRIARSHGLSLRMWTGEEMGEAEWKALWRFYRRTTSRKWGQAYLRPAFFEWLRTHDAEAVRVAFAHAGHRPVAGALFFERGEALYGRYWGSLGDYDCLHFELCYYQAIEWCLARGLTRFEAGAQGAHKVRRGLLPREIYSAHWLRHPGLARAVAEALPVEEAEVRAEMAELARHGPFRRG